SPLAFDALNPDGTVHFVAVPLSVEGALPIVACYVGDVVFAASCSSALTQNVTRTAAEITANPSSVHVFALQGRSTVQTVDITSNGPVDNLTFGPVLEGASEVSWVSGTWSSLSTPATLRLEITPPSTVPAGEHVLTVPVSSASAPASHPTVTLDISVFDASSRFVLTPESFDVGPGVVGGFPLAKALFTVVNTGATSLTTFTIAMTGANPTEFVFTGPGT